MPEPLRAKNTAAVGVVALQIGLFICMAALEKKHCNRLRLEWAAEYQARTEQRRREWQARSEQRRREEEQEAAERRENLAGFISAACSLCKYCFRFQEHGS